MPALPTNSCSIGSESLCSHHRRSTVIALNDLGSQLYLAGHQGQALAIFESALKALRLTTPLFTARSSEGELHVRVKMPKADCCNGLHYLDYPPDTYLEGECDVGPRPIRSPLHLVVAPKEQSLQLAVLFNTAIVLQSSFKLEEALGFYEECARFFSVTAQREIATTDGEWLSHVGMILHNNIGQLFYCLGREESAQYHFAQSRMWSQKTVADDHSSRLIRATCMSNYGRTKWMLGSVDDEAYELCREVLRLRSSVLPEGHIDIACARYNLGIMAYAQHDKGLATEHLRAYLSASSVTNNERILDPIPAIAYIVLMENEEKCDAVSHELVRAVRGLQDKRDDLGAEHAEIASLLNYIGTILFHRRELESAILFYKEELRLEERLGRSEPSINVSVTYNNIGRILQELGQLPEAIGCYQQALKSDLASGSEHDFASSFAGGHANLPLDPNVSDDTKNLFSTIWYNLGLIYDRMGSRTEAISAFQMSLELRMALLGGDHPDVACLWYNIGTLQMEQEQVELASLALRQALRIQRLRGFGHDPQHAMNSLQKLSKLQKSHGDIDGALMTFQEMANVQESIHSTHALGNTFLEIADLFHSKGDLNQALRHSYQSCDALRSCVLVANSFSFEMDMKATEDFSKALLMTASLLHESCEPVQANEVLLKVFECLQVASARYGGTLTRSIESIKEVCRGIVSSQCAPGA